MNTLESLKEANAQLAAQVEAETARANQAEEAARTASAERDEARASLSDATTALQEATQTLAATQADLTVARAEIETLKKNATTTEERAARLLASAGHEGFLAITPGTDAGGGGKSGTADAADLRAEYASITDPKARGEFYAKHRDQMLTS